MSQAPFTCALNLAHEVAVSTAVSGTVDIGAIDSNRIALTGTDATSHFGTGANRYRIVRFVSATPLVNSAALNLIDGASRTTKPGSYSSFVSDDTGNWSEIANSGGTLGVGTAMLFLQAAAPVGWSKSTAHNDKALRIVSGSGGGAGGSVSWTTAFGPGALTGAIGAAVDFSYLTTADVSAWLDDAPNVQSSWLAILNATLAGSAQGHQHAMPQVLYVDAIICTKN